IAIAIQYWARRKMPVRSQKTSARTVPTTESTASTVYSGIALLPLTPPAEHRADRLVGQQPADRDDDEEDDLLQRHVAREPDAGRVPLAVRPVPARDAHDVPDQEDREHRKERQQQPPGAPVDPGAQEELQRQGDDQAARHEQEVLIAVVHGPASRRLGVGAQGGSRRQPVARAGGPG